MKSPSKILELYKAMTDPKLFTYEEYAAEMADLCGNQTPITKQQWDMVIELRGGDRTTSYSTHLELRRELLERALGMPKTASAKVTNN